MNSDDSDDDLLANLLASADDDEQIPNNTSSSQKLPSTALKELDFNFLDDISDNFDEEQPKTKQSTSYNKQHPKATNESVLINEDCGNSSDEEDKKYFEQQRYSEYGRDIKNLLKSKESENTSLSTNFKKENSFNTSVDKINTTPKSNKFSKLKADSPSLSNNFNSLLQKSDRNSLQVQASSDNSIHKDVYSDPVFGLRIIRPLISSAELLERMQGRKAVTVSAIKSYLTNASMGNSTEDWVIAGVLLNKSATKTSQKGSQYCIWKISDLSTDMKSVSVFLFSNAYKNLWKIAVGTVVGILNPSVLESRDDKDLATLSVDNSQKIMVLGTSRDLGKCKSMKKNGEPCTAPVNLKFCEYCVYHVKQEYGKFSKRSELQTVAPRRAFGPTNNALNSTNNFQKRHPEALPFLAIPAKRNEALYKKDCERLALLRGEVKAVEKKVENKVTTDKKVKACSVELSTNQVKKDFERLSKLRAWDASKNVTSPPSRQETKPQFKLNLPSPKLGSGVKGGIIDFSDPIPNQFVNRAKLNAIEFAKKNGGFQKSNPNKIRPNKEDLLERGVKRKRQGEESEKIAKETTDKESTKSKFQEMLEMTSAHSDLIEKRDNEETEQYFRKLETKERMEEKMLTTYKIDCKAVRCGICKYTAFSSSDLCKKLQHPIKVLDAVKRFFKCGDCGNRTVSLDRIPTETCKRCSSSKWVKTAMMDEKRTQIATSKLCIRGGEEKFIGSTITDASLNLLIPEAD